MYYAETFKFIKFFIRESQTQKSTYPDASIGVQCSTFRTVCSHKVVAVGFNTLRYDASVGVLNPPHESISAKRYDYRCLEFCQFERNNGRLRRFIFGYRISEGMRLLREPY